MDLENDFDDLAFKDPYQLNADEVETLRRMARYIVDREKCAYTKAVVIAYIEWLGMVELGESKH